MYSTWEAGDLNDLPSCTLGAWMKVEAVVMGIQPQGQDRLYSCFGTMGLKTTKAVFRTVQSARRSSRGPVWSLV